jgi:hypothetical protein
MLVKNIKEKKNLMMKRMNFILLRLFLLIACLMVLSSSSGCNSKYHKMFAVREERWFLFEYPVDYWQDSSSLPFLDIADEGTLSFVNYFSFPHPDRSRKEMLIDYYDLAYVPPNAKLMMDDWVSSLEDIDEGLHTGFELYYRAPITISGIKGEMIYFTNQFQECIPFFSSPVKCWLVYLDYKEKIWEFLVLSNPEAADEAQQDFSHLVKTFRFLN